MLMPANRKTRPRNHIEIMPRDLIIRLNDHGYLCEELADQSPVSNLFVQCQRIGASAQYLHETPDIRRSSSPIIARIRFHRRPSSHSRGPLPTQTATESRWLRDSRSRK